MTLECEPVEIRDVPDGAAALEMARQWQPDLVLADVMMPGTMDGLGLCRALRADPQLCDVPVMMISARGHQIDREAGLEAGANTYLVKPFSPMELLERSIELLNRSKPPK